MCKVADIFKNKYYYSSSMTTNYADVKDKNKIFHIYPLSYITVAAIFS